MRGAVLFAFNNGTVDYYRMATYTGKRINDFLNLPVTVITDSNTQVDSYDYKFDQTIIVDSDISNSKNGKAWINKGRYRVYELSPYDETLVLDTDYMVNSNQLLKLFDIYDDFICHDKTSFLFKDTIEQELVSPSSFETLWATVMLFRKTEKVKQLFHLLGMIQHNYAHYFQLYNMVSHTYRNDYALTIALRILNGQLPDNKYIPWPLLHVSNDVKIQRQSVTGYTAFHEVNSKLSTKQLYMNIIDTDFHMLNKTNFMELMNE